MVSLLSFIMEVSYKEGEGFIWPELLHNPRNTQSRDLEVL